MATNIDQALMPLDMSQMTEEPALEIEIEDPESVNIKAGDVEISLELEGPEGPEEFDANLAEYMEEGAQIGRAHV